VKFRSRVVSPGRASRLLAETWLVLIAGGCASPSAGMSAVFGETAGSPFIDGGDGTVEDLRSGHVWQQTVPYSYAPYCTGRYYPILSPDGDACSWQDAQRYCSELALAGGGWRLPSKEELQSIVDDERDEPAIDLTAFPDAQPDVFWSSSSVDGSPELAWYVFFSHGSANFSAPRSTFRVRCVR